MSYNQSQGVKDIYTRRLKILLLKYDPVQAGRVGALVEGTEDLHQLYEDYCQKYGESPQKRFDLPTQGNVKVKTTVFKKKKKPRPMKLGRVNKKKLNHGGDYLEESDEEAGAGIRKGSENILSTRRGREREAEQTSGRRTRSAGRGRREDQEESEATKRSERRRKRETAKRKTEPKTKSSFGRFVKSKNQDDSQNTRSTAGGMTEYTGNRVVKNARKATQDDNTRTTAGGMTEFTGNRVVKDTRKAQQDDNSRRTGRATNRTRIDRTVQKDDDSDDDVDWIDNIAEKEQARQDREKEEQRRNRRNGGNRKEYVPPTQNTGGDGDWLDDIAQEVYDKEKEKKQRNRRNGGERRDYVSPAQNDRDVQIRQTGRQENGPEFRRRGPEEVQAMMKSEHTWIDEYTDAEMAKDAQKTRVTGGGMMEYNPANNDRMMKKSDIQFNDYGNHGNQDSPFDSPRSQKSNQSNRSNPSPMQNNRRQQYGKHPRNPQRDNRERQRLMYQQNTYSTRSRSTEFRQHFRTPPRQMSEFDDSEHAMLHKLFQSLPPVYEKYMQGFIDEGVDSEILLNLNMSDLQSLYIDNAIHQKRIYKELERLKNQYGVQGDTTPLRDWLAENELEFLYAELLKLHIGDPDSLLQASDDDFRHIRVQLNLPLSIILRLKRAVQKKKSEQAPPQASNVKPGLSEDQVREIADRVISIRMQEMLENLSAKIEATTSKILESERDLRTRIDEVRERADGSSKGLTHYKDVVAMEIRNLNERISSELNHFRNRMHEMEIQHTRHRARLDIAHSHSLRGSGGFDRVMESASWHEAPASRQLPPEMKESEEEERSARDTRFDSVILPGQSSPRKRNLSTEMRKRGESIEFHVQGLVDRMKNANGNVGGSVTPMQTKREPETRPVVKKGGKGGKKSKFERMLAKQEKRQAKREQRRSDRLESKQEDDTSVAERLQNMSGLKEKEEDLESKQFNSEVPGNSNFLPPKINTQLDSLSPKRQIDTPRTPLSPEASKKKKAALKKFTKYANAVSEKSIPPPAVGDFSFEEEGMAPEYDFKAKDMVCSDKYTFISGGKQVIIFDNNTNKLKTTWEFPKPVSVMCLSPKQTFLFAAGPKDRVFVKPLKSGEIQTYTATMKKGDKVMKFINAICCTQTHMFVGGRGTKYAYGFQLAAKKKRPQVQFKHGDDVTSLCAHGDYVFTSGKRGRTKLFNATSGIEVKTFRDLHAINTSAVVHEGLYLITGSDMGHFSEWNTLYGNKMREFKFQQSITSFIISPKLQYVLVLSHDIIYALNLTTTEREETHINELPHINVKDRSTICGRTTEDYPIMVVSAVGELTRYNFNYS